VVEPIKIDRRKRRADDPTVPITVNIPVALLESLDDFVVERNATRSGMIRIAVIQMLKGQAKSRKRTSRTSYPRAFAKTRVRGS
jgi:hypothetical protein